MRFQPYSRVSSLPNIIVDGAATEGTVLTLSHWPKSGTPAGLKADTSTEIVFNYLDSPAFHVQADAVSNNHFDEDGLLGIYALVKPSAAAPHRKLLIDAARAGDFGVFVSRDAARVAFTLSAYADADRSRLPADTFRLPYADQTARLYSTLLELVPHLLDNLNEYRTLWEREDRELSASEDLLESGVVSLEERAELDLAIAWIPEDLDVHPFALHNRTTCSRLLRIHGARLELQYRYESWVQMVSRRPALRRDLSALAKELTESERTGARWVFDGVDHITPALHLERDATSSLAPEVFLARVEAYLRSAPPAWDPYD